MFSNALHIANYVFLLDYFYIIFFLYPHRSDILDYYADQNQFTMEIFCQISYFFL